MIRTQIQLNDEQYQALQQLAREHRISMAEIVRQGVDLALAQLDRRRKWEKVRALAGEFSSRESDIARKHDEYLAKAFHHKKK